MFQGVIFTVQKSMRVFYLCSAVLATDSHKDGGDRTGCAGIRLHGLYPVSLILFVNSL